MTQLKDGGRQPGNREERSLSASTVIARWQGNGWDEPCKSRGLRTVLREPGAEMPPATHQSDLLTVLAVKGSGVRIPSAPLLHPEPRHLNSCRSGGVFNI
jgi:hypothetical protein